MKVADILSQGTQFPTIRTDSLVRDGARLMQEHDVRALPVVEGDRLVGIVTDWDIVVAFADRADELGELPVAAVMTSDDLITIDEHRSVAAATEVLASNRVHHLPVVADGRYVGMLCLGLEWSEEDKLTPPMRPTLTARHP